MLNIALTSIVIIGSVLGVSLPKAFEEPVYLVPTAVSTIEEHADKGPEEGERWATDFEWRVKTALQEEVQRLAPRKTDWDKGPEIYARTAIVMDESSQAILWQLNPEHVQAMASITKLMTALVWLDHQPEGGFFAEHTFTSADNAPQGKELNLPMGERMTLYNIWRSTLVSSDNDTALALAHSSTLSHDQFIRAMNAKAHMLGMTKTHFADPTGLSAQNTATAEDVARLALYAFAQRDIVDATIMTSHVQETIDTKIRTVARTTNELLRDDELDITGGKTGYTDEAGYCVVERVRIPGTERNIIVVILGADTNAERFSEAKKLAAWALAHYQW